MIASMHHPCCKRDEVDADHALKKERALCIAFICHVNRFLIIRRIHHLIYFKSLNYLLLEFKTK